MHVDRGNEFADTSDNPGRVASKHRLILASDCTQADDELIFAATVLFVIV